MKRFFVLSVVALLALSFIGCDQADRDYPPAQSAAPQTSAPETTEPTTEPTVSPASESSDIFGEPVVWEKIYTVGEGYEVRTVVEIWSPVRFDTDYPHPARPELVMTNPDGVAEDACWVIPFKYSLSNLMEGFPPVSVDTCIGLHDDNFLSVSLSSSVLAYNKETLVGKVNLWQDNTDVYDYALQERQARCLCAVWYGNIGLKTSMEVAASDNVELKENTRNNLVGYFIVTDKQRTPNSPNGSDLSPVIYTGIGEGDMLTVDIIAQIEENEQGELILKDS